MRSPGVNAVDRRERSRIVCSLRCFGVGAGIRTKAGIVFRQARRTGYSDAGAPDEICVAFGDCKELPLVESYLQVPQNWQRWASSA